MATSSASSSRRAMCDLPTETCGVRSRLRRRGCGTPTYRPRSRPGSSILAYQLIYDSLRLRLPLHEPSAIAVDYPMPTHRRVRRNANRKRDGDRIGLPSSEVATLAEETLGRGDDC